MTEWKPVVGGRAMFDGVLPCVLVNQVNERTWGAVSGERYIRVQTFDLAEHPDDARHRRLLEAARDLVNCGYDLKTVTRLQSAVQAIDQAEADHA